MDLPIENGDLPIENVSLPEGMDPLQTMANPSHPWWTQAIELEENLKRRRKATEWLVATGG